MPKKPVRKPKPPANLLFLLKDRRDNSSPLLIESYVIVRPRPLAHAAVTGSKRIIITETEELAYRVFETMEAGRDQASVRWCWSARWREYAYPILGVTLQDALNSFPQPILRVREFEYLYNAKENPFGWLLGPRHH